MTRPYVDPLDPWAADHEIGLRDDQIQELQREMALWELRARWNAIKALWAPPIVRYVRKDGVAVHERDRDEEWTCWRAVRCTLGLVFKLPSWAPTYHAVTLAFWDSHSDGYGYSAMVVELRGWFGASVFSDGESWM